MRNVSSGVETALPDFNAAFSENAVTMIRRHGASPVPVIVLAVGTATSAPSAPAKRSADPMTVGDVERGSPIATLALSSRSLR